MRVKVAPRSFLLGVSLSCVLWGENICFKLTMSCVANTYLSDLFNGIFLHILLCLGVFLSKQHVVSVSFLSPSWTQHIISVCMFPFQLGNNRIHSSQCFLLLYRGTKPCVSFMEKVGTFFYNINRFRKFLEILFQKLKSYVYVWILP